MGDQGVTCPRVKLQQENYAAQLRFGKSSAPCSSSQEYLSPHGNVRTWNMTIANSTSCNLANKAIASLATTRSTFLHYGVDLYVEWHIIVQFSHFSHTHHAQSHV